MMLLLGDDLDLSELDLPTGNKLKSYSCPLRFLTFYEYMFNYKISVANYLPAQMTWSLSEELTALVQMKSKT